MSERQPKSVEGVSQELEPRKMEIDDFDAGVLGACIGSMARYGQDEDQAMARTVLKGLAKNNLPALADDRDYSWQAPDTFQARDISLTADQWQFVEQVLGDNAKTIRTERRNGRTTLMDPAVGDKSLTGPEYLGGQKVGQLLRDHNVIDPQYLHTNYLHTDHPRARNQRKLDLNDYSDRTLLGSSRLHEILKAVSGTAD